MRKQLLRVIILLTWLGFLGVLIYLIYGLKEIRLNRAFIQSYILSYHLWAPAVFLGLSSLRGFTFIPRGVFVAMGGFIFGPVTGFVLSWGGIIISSTLIFWTARYLGGDFAQRYLKKRLPDFDELIEEHGTKIIALCALVPVAPADLVCYGAGLTRMPYRRFIVAISLGEIPLTLIYSILGNELQIAERFGYALGGLIIFAVAVSFIGKRIYRKIELGDKTKARR